MASAFSHISCRDCPRPGSALETLATPVLGAFVLCSILPDADVVGLAAGIPYEHLFGHRGLTHSLIFSCVMGLLVVRLGFSSVNPGTRVWWSLVMHFFFVTASHGVLDALTNGGLGVAFFAPFDNSRYFFPWTPIKVSPIGISEFFTNYGMEVLVSELTWVEYLLGSG